jgi:tripartite-type tricarboxylate transporter receptor subunit TctC
MPDTQRTRLKMPIYGLCRLAVVCAVSIALPALPARADDYPSRSITIAVPLAAGTGMDVLARIFAEHLAKSLGKPVVVENQPGAALTLPVQNVARAAPDGYTLAVAEVLVAIEAGPAPDVPAAAFRAKAQRSATRWCCS